MTERDRLHQAWVVGLMAAIIRHRETGPRHDRDTVREARLLLGEVVGQILEEDETMATEVSP